LVRYIHLNPVRAGMVDRPEQYQYSGHRAYLGLERAGLVDTDPVLRHFGARKKVAREAYVQFVGAGMNLGHQSEFYQAEEGRILGTEEFVDAIIHRIGDATLREKRSAGKEVNPELNADALIDAVERSCRMASVDFCGSGKNALAVTAKEVLVMVGSQLGANPKVLSEIAGMSRSAVSRRKDAARLKMQDNGEMRTLAASVWKLYQENCRRIAKSQA